MSRDIYILVVMIATAALLVGCGKKGRRDRPALEAQKDRRGRKVYKECR